MRTPCSGESTEIDDVACRGALPSPADNFPNDLHKRIAHDLGKAARAITRENTIALAHGPVLLDLAQALPKPLDIYHLNCYDAEGFF